MTRLEPFWATTRASLGRLKAAVWTSERALPGREDEVDHPKRSEGADLRVPPLRPDREPVLQPLQLAREPGQLLRLLFVSHADEGLEGRLVAEPAVVVHLVGSDGGLDRGVELHPGHVALEVVVAEEGLRPLLEIGLQRRLAGGHRRLAQELGGPGQLALVLDAVGNRGEGPVRRPTNRREVALGGRPLGLGERLEPGRHLFLGGPRGIEVGGQGPLRHTGDEGDIVVEPGPGTVVDEERVHPRFAQPGVAVAEKLAQKGLVSGPDLPEVERGHDPSGLDRLRQGLALVRRQAGEVGPEIHRGEASGHRPQGRLVGDRRLSSRRHRGEGHDQNERRNEYRKWGPHRGPPHGCGPDGRC